ncbi:hypothetical protein [Intestinimonas sp. HCP28S3_D6]|uniref:hypothetical protein n=1 Tax=Intestinimonas sp. HCP28S3_D6 TaxID=3438942 RepID=UPI003F88AE45
MRRPAAALLTLVLTAAVSTAMLAAAPRLTSTPEERAIQALNQRYGLDDPADTELQLYLENLLHGDVGWSIQP